MKKTNQTTQTKTKKNAWFQSGSPPLSREAVLAQALVSFGQVTTDLSGPFARAMAKAKAKGKAKAKAGARVPPALKRPAAAIADVEEGSSWAKKAAIASEPPNVEEESQLDYSSCTRQQCTQHNGCRCTAPCR